MNRTYSLLIIALMTAFPWLGSQGQAAAPIGAPAVANQTNDNSDADQVVALEKRTWETAQSHDLGGYGDLLADDFVLINEEGVSNKGANLMADS